jgi:hypothetical protein
LTLNAIHPQQLARVLASGKTLKLSFMNGIIYLIAKGHILLVISLLRSTSNLVISPHLPSVVVGYIDSNNAIILSSRHTTEKLAQY